MWSCLYPCVFLNREYVVDLVGEPGNVHGPDSSINGGLLSSMPSPLQISHLKEYQQPYMDNESCCQIQNSKNTCIYPEDPLYLGMLCFAHLEICCSSGSIHYSGVGFLRYNNYPEISGFTYPGLQQKLKKMSI